MVGQFQALVDDVAWQDTYTTMFAGTQGFIDTMKPVGETAITLSGDGTQKGNWTATTSTEYQSYVADNDTTMATMTLMYGQPVRQSGGGITAWQLNDYGRVFLVDNNPSPKLYVFGSSSEQVPPRTANALPQGTIIQWQNKVVSKYKSGGPT